MSDHSRQQESTPFNFRGIWVFLARRKGQGRFEITDFLTYLYLIAGILVMFGPVIWLVMSSFKDEALLFEPKPTFLPYRQSRTVVEGYENELLLFDVTFNDVYIEDATITRLDLRASNGVVHGIDRLLLPPELKEALANLDTAGADAASLPQSTEAIPLEGEGNVWQITQSQADFSMMTQ
jgi:ABC-type glycerol-3-phosphate transport system permease component